MTSVEQRLGDLQHQLNEGLRNLATIREAIGVEQRCCDWRKLLANIADPALLVHDGIIEWANGLCGELLGLPTSAIVGQHATTVVTLEGGSGYDVLRTAAGRGSVPICLLNSTEAPIHMPGRIIELEPTRFAIIGRDQRDLDNVREAAAKSAELKSSFLASMSHEIRTPMNGVIGMAELLADTPLNTEQRELIDTIRRSGQWLIELINDILDLAKIEAGETEVNREPFDLYQSLSDFRAVYQQLAARKGLRLNLEIDKDVPQYVRGDAGRLRQVLTNLVGNALKFTERGRVKISVSTTNDGRLRFVVVDTGPGIPQEERRRLFRAFAQANSKIHSQHGGTGLGLAISKQLVEMMGGQIGVDSQVGQGSRFWFTVLLDEAAADHIQAPESPHKRGGQVGSLMVLCAEDNVVNREVLARMLEKLGHRFVLVEDGKRAVDAARRQRFDVVLMDCQMPIMDGLEATRILREDGDDTPIIALTASALPGDKERCLAVGMTAHVTKPVTFAGLREALEDTCAGMGIQGLSAVS